MRNIAEVNNEELELDVPIYDDDGELLIYLGTEDEGVISVEIVKGVLQVSIYDHSSTNLIAKINMPDVTLTEVQ